MDPNAFDLKAAQTSIQAALVATTKSANRIAAEDLSFQRTVNPSIGDRLEEGTSRLLNLATGLLKAAAGPSKGEETGSKGKKRAPAVTLEEPEDIDLRWRSIVDSIDGLLEKADTCLDEYTGLVKRRQHATPENAPALKKPKTVERLDNSLRRANILKPQLAFEHKPDNANKGPWKPILTSKPHAKVPLEESLSTFSDENNETQYRSPYEQEIRSLAYPQAILRVAEPIKYLPVERTSATWVDTWEGVLSMLEELKQASEIAVDLEHHDYRTYSGLLSLMQISTREKDWIVDTLKPWRHKLEILNEVFADPSIIKVFHGAFMDVVWLQRDLGLYIVGLFDTYHASVKLDYSGRSLAFLLSRFADFEADKKYQMADWRIRPLPEEMYYYARSDTHYLLYVYDMMRNALVEASDASNPETNLIQIVLERSKEVSLSRYEAQTADYETGFGPKGWYNHLVKMPSVFTGEQFAVYRAMHQWRDEIARQEDESTGFIMTQQTLMEISKIIPTDPKALHSLLNHSSQQAKHALNSIFEIISKAKEAGAHGPRSLDYFAGPSLGAIAQQVKDEQRTARADELPSAQDLTSSGSQLWGQMPLSSLWDKMTTGLTTAVADVRIALPWTKYVEDALATTSKQDTLETPAADVDMIPLVGSTPVAKAAAVPPAATKQDNVESTLRQGRKRKIEQVVALSEDDTSSDDDDDEVGASLLDPTGELSLHSKTSTTPTTSTTTPTEEIISLQDPKTQKKSRSEKRAARQADRKSDKAARKAAKRASKEMNNNMKIDSAPHTANEEYDTPFDYKQARSVMYADREGGGIPGLGAAAGGSGGGKGEGVDAKGRKAPYDPYRSRMTAEGPKPARRTQAEKNGRSATFRK